MAGDELDEYIASLVPETPEEQREIAWLRAHPGEMARVRIRFLQKLAQRYPGHPWAKLLAQEGGGDGG